MMSHDDLVRLWGEANIVRAGVDPNVLTLPADAVAVLRDVGLPRRVDYLFEISDLAMIKGSGPRRPLLTFRD
jgi:hypothetical protein